MEALAVAGAIDCDCDRVFALAHIARNQPSLGDPSGAARTIGSALEVARRMADGRARASALCWIAEAQVRSGDRDAALRSIAGALEAVNGTERGSDPDGIGPQIAVAQATAGDNRGALATVRRIAEESGMLTGVEFCPLIVTRYQDVTAPIGVESARRSTVGHQDACVSASRLRCSRPLSLIEVQKTVSEIAFSFIFNAENLLMKRNSVQFSGFFFLDERLNPALQVIEREISREWIFAPGILLKGCKCKGLTGPSWA